MEFKQRSFVSKVWKDRDIVGYEDANRWETGIGDAHNEISAIKEILESLGGSGTNPDTPSGIIDDSIEAGNPSASTHTWSVKKIAEQLSGKVGQDELKSAVDTAVTEAVAEAVQEEVSNLDGLITKSPTAPSNLDSIWLDTQA